MINRFSKCYKISSIITKKAPEEILGSPNFTAYMRIFFFAFSTIISWNLFGKINAIYLFGKNNAKISVVVYTLIALIFIFVGTTVSNDLAWELTDMFNNLMVIPNTIALFALTGVVVNILHHKNDK